MATISGRYLGQLRTEAVHLSTGVAIHTDAPKDNHGRGEGFSPTDLVCSSLASCMLTLMGITANKRQLNIDGASFVVTKIMTAEPRRIGEIKIEFVIPDTTLSNSDRELLEKAARSCPVALSLHPDIRQTISFAYQAS